MGQPVSVIEKPSSRGGVVRFEVNRVLTGTGHERYLKERAVEGERPPDVVARRLFQLGGIDRIHVNGNVITVELSRGATTAGMREVIEDLYTYYRPGVEVPSFPTDEAPAEAAPAEG